MKLEFEIESFSLPNFLQLQCTGNSTKFIDGNIPKFDVAELSDQQASEYWDRMKSEWLKHVSDRRSIAKADVAANKRR